LPDADGGPLLSFERLYVNLAWISALRLGLDFQAIAIDKPQLRVVRRAQGQINLEDLAPPADPMPDPQPDKQAAPPRLWIGEFAMRDGKATLVDLDRPTPLTLSLRPITFTLREFSTRSDGNAYVLAVQSTLGEQLNWRGTFGLAPLESRGTFSLDHLQAHTLAEIVAEQAPFEISGGELDLKGDYVFAERGKTLAIQANVPQLVINALGIRGRGEAQDALLIPRLTVTGTHIDVNAQTLTVEHVALEDAKLNVVRSKDGELNLERLIPREHGAESGGAPEKPWHMSVPDLRIDRADISLLDRQPSHPARLRFAPLSIAVGGFSSPAQGPLAVRLETNVDETGHFVAQGELSLAALTGHFDLDANALPLTPLQPYLDDDSGLIIRTGRANLHGALTLGSEHALSFEGKAGIDELETADQVLGEDFINWRSLQLLGLRARSQPLSVEIAQIAVSEPYARVIIGRDHVTNLHDVLSPRNAEPPPPTAAGPTPTAAPASAALPIEIGIVRVDGGSLNFSDQSLKPNFTTGVEHLAGTIKGLSARPDARADVDLAGAVDRYTPVKIKGKVNYFAAVKHTKLHLNFKNVELTSFSPYSGKFAGYKIERGKLNLDLDYTIDDRRIEAKHRIVMNQLQLGESVASPDATSLPVKLAVALLKDRNGVIDLDLPVSGNMDDPQFKIGPILWKVVVNLLGKAVTAPFALLGSLFGGGDEISYIDFAPGSGVLDPNARAKLHTLAKALDARPALNLDVPLVTEPQADRAALADARWHAQIQARASQQLGARGKNRVAVAKLIATPSEYRSLLESIYRQAFGSRPTIPQPPPPAATATAPPPIAAVVAPRAVQPNGPGHGAVAHQLQRAAAVAQPAAAAPTAAQPTATASIVPQSTTAGPVAAARPSAKPVRAQGPGHGALGHGLSSKSAAPAIPDAYAIAWLERQLKTRINVSAPELDELAQERAQNVQSTLLDGSGIDPGRVFVISAPPLKAAKGPLRMQLALH
jgi:uncharacterized protein involved in outer membrane biogenesis